MICTHPELKPWLDAIQLAERVVTVLLLPQVAGVRIEGHAESVANAVGKDLWTPGAAEARLYDRPERSAMKRAASAVHPV
jgi:hypothetical protein